MGNIYKKYKKSTKNQSYIILLVLPKVDPESILMQMYYIEEEAAMRELKSIIYLT